MENVKREIRNLRKEIESLEEECRKREKRIDRLRKIKYTINHKSVGTGGHDEHYMHTVSLQIKDYTIKNEKWDDWKILVLDKENIKDLYETLELYSQSDLQTFMTKESWRRLEIYADYKNEF